MDLNFRMKSISTPRFAWTCPGSPNPGMTISSMSLVFQIPQDSTMYHIDSDTRKDQEHKQLRKHMSQEQKLTFMREHGIFVGQPGWEWTGKDDSKQLPEGSVFAGKV